MEAVMFIGIQAVGKSTFFKERFSDTHVRINLDMLRTRHRERLLFECCLAMKQRFVIDNTNLTREDRQRYFALITEHKFELHGYYFSSSLEEALARNAARDKVIPERGVLSAHRRLELPSYDEGFKNLYYVKQVNGSFEVSDWEN